MNEDQLPFSITTARKLLGKASWNLTDEEITAQIELASMLKDIFFVTKAFELSNKVKGNEYEKNV